MIPYGKQDISEEDIAAVVEVLKSDFITQGPRLIEFEEAVSHYCGSEYAVAVNSATSALHIACLALGLGEGDLLWTSPNSFVASANCGLYCGAKVDFVDIDANTYNLSADELEKKLQQAKVDNRLPKVIVAVHFAGQPCEMQRIHQLSKEYGFKIIEDASHAIGGRYLDNKIGSCEFSDITVFSFHPVKIITTAEGGMALTRQPELAEKMRLYRSHGVTRDADLMTKPAEGDWYYQQVELGFNYRMTDMQAALGTSQLQRLDEFVARRHQLLKQYQDLLQGLPIKLPFQHADGYSALHLFPVQIDSNLVAKSRRQVFDELRILGIGVNVHYIPIHTQPYYQQLGFNKGDFPVSEQYYDNAISLPMFHSMTDEQQLEVVSSLKKVLLGN